MRMWAGYGGLIRRTVICSALGACVVSATPSDAGPGYRPARGACTVITDAQGDAQDPTASGAEGSLDILSADLRSDRASFTVAMQVAKLDVEQRPGYAYVFDFMLGEQNLFLQGTLLPGGDDFWAYEASGGPHESRSAVGIGEVKGVVDGRRGVIIMTASISTFAKYGMHAGSTMTGLNASTWRANGASTESITAPTGSHVSAAGGIGADDAGTSKKYRTGTRC